MQMLVRTEGFTHDLEEICFNKLDFTGFEKAYVSLHEAIFLLTVLEEVHDREFP